MVLQRCQCWFQSFLYFTSTETYTSILAGFIHSLLGSLVSPLPSWRQDAGWQSHTMQLDLTLQLLGIVLSSNRFNLVYYCILTVSHKCELLGLQIFSAVLAILLFAPDVYSSLSFDWVLGPEYGSSQYLRILCHAGRDGSWRICNFKRLNRK